MYRLLSASCTHHHSALLRLATCATLYLALLSLLLNMQCCAELYAARCLLQARCTVHVGSLRYSVTCYMMFWNPAHATYNLCDVTWMHGLVQDLGICGSQSMMSWLGLDHESCQVSKSHCLMFSADNFRHDELSRLIGPPLQVACGIVASG